MNEHTWLSHDLPPYEVTPESPPRTIRWRAQVFKASQAWASWAWTHQCGPKAQAATCGGYLTQGMALRAACEHMRGHG